MKYLVDVVIFKNLISIDKLYTYEADEFISAGDYVIVDFNEQVELALVIRAYRENVDFPLKSVQKKVKELQALDEEHIKLGLWMKEFYVLTYAKAFSTICDFTNISNLTYSYLISDALDENEKIEINNYLSEEVKNKKIIDELVASEKIKKFPIYFVSKAEKDIYYAFNFSLEDALKNLRKNATRQIQLVNNIYEAYYHKGYFNLFLIKDKLVSYSKAVFDDLINKGIFSVTEAPEEDVKITSNLQLTQSQNDIVDSILNSINNKHLIHGVTGSGKTAVYFSIIDNILKEGNSAIFLVPEIGLTPQMQKRAKDRFGDLVAIIHSKLTKSRRLQEIEKIKSGKARILLGTRSAIFFQIPNLKLIIIDEEHDDSYKLDNHNKYDVREVARFLIENNSGAKLVMGSATPSIESYFKAQNKVYDLHELMERPNNIKLPDVSIVDLKDEISYGNNTPFSMDLMVAIKNSLISGKQTLLFLNRRGYSQFVTCQKCGYTVTCDKCDISMVYHKHSNLLKCHYCGAVQKLPHRCPNCGSDEIVLYGLGTEKLEELAKSNFLDLGILRIDSDTTNKEEDYINNMENILSNNVNIIIGTQMITKGFDYPNIETVGIISADMSLNVPNYDSSEKTFQLLMQVAGRAGRADSKGNVVIQTFNPEHYAIKTVVNHDYKSFYDEELKMRKLFSYPPFSRQFELLILNNDLKQGLNISKEIYKSLEEMFIENKIMEFVNLISNINKPYISRINNRYHIKLYFSCKIRYEKQVKKCIYDILIKNIKNLNLKGIHLDVVSR